ncbi:MAG: hypothetical protein KDC48_00565 [Planctomycetes bacterium]|nr:hypothetical protein [Planctomycetota bacterium]
MLRLLHARSAAAAACLVAAAVAQARPADGREPTFVRVFSEAHAPLAGAEVTLVGCVPEIEGGPVDRVVAVSDARGRVMARLRTDLCYAAWATGPAAANGAAAVSNIEGYFAAGAMFDLSCDEVVEPQPISIAGLEPYLQRGPVRLFVLGWNSAADFELQAVDGGWVLPPSPLCKATQVGVRTLELRTGDGQPLLWFQGVLANLVVPPPKEVPIVVVDDKGQPLAGVSIKRRVGQLQAWRLDGYGGATRSRWSECGRTDAGGRLVATVPCEEAPLEHLGSQEFLFFAEAPGRTQVVGGVRYRNVYVNDHRVDKFEGKELRFELPAVPPLVGRCPDLPAGTMVSLQSVARLWSSDNGFMHDYRSWTVPLGDDGRFEFAGLPDGLYSSRVSFWHPDRQLKAPLLQAESAKKVPDVLRVDGAAAPVFSELQVSVLDVHGGPARGGVLQIGPGNRSGTQLRYSIARVPLDTAGSARLLLPPGPQALLAVTAHGFAGKLCVVPAGVASCELQLQPFAAMPVRFVDNDDQPIAGATLRVTRATTRGSSDPVQGLLQGMESQLRWRMMQLRTGADGRLSIPFVPIEGVTLQLTLQSDRGATMPFEIEAADEEVELRPK